MHRFSTKTHTLFSGRSFFERAWLASATLKGRLTAAVVVLVATSSVVVAAVALQIASQDEVETTGSQQLNLLTSAASHLEAELASRRNLLKLVTEEITASDVTGRSIQKILAHHTSLLLSFSNVIILDSRGLLLADMKASSKVGHAMYSNRSYFKDTLRLRRGVLSQPIISTLSGKPVVLITEPVLDRTGNVQYIIGGGIDLANPTFFGQIVRLRAGSTGYLFAITKDGLVLHHPDVSRLARNVNQEAGPAVISTKAALDGWEGWVLAKNKRGLPGILTYKQMTNSGWILGSFFPADEAFAGISKARRYGWISALGIAILAGLIGWSTILHLLKPLQSLRQHVTAVEQEQAGIAVFDLSRDDEVGALGRAFHSLSLKRATAEHRLQLLSQTDSLTGLANRRQFDYEISAVVERATEMQHAIAIGFLDIDNFKLINDTYGHAVGDSVLVEFSRRLKANLRPTDQPFRLAGDEFVVVIEHIESVGSVERLASRLIEAIRLPFQLENLELSVTTSIGFAITKPPMSQAGDLLQHADAALYKTKRAGRDGYTIKELGRVREKLKDDL